MVLNINYKWGGEFVKLIDIIGIIIFIFALILNILSDYYEE